MKMMTMATSYEKAQKSVIFALSLSLQQNRLLPTTASLSVYSNLKKTDTAKLSEVTSTASRPIGSVVDLRAHGEQTVLYSG